MVMDGYGYGSLSYDEIHMCCGLTCIASHEIEGGVSFAAANEQNALTFSSDRLMLWRHGRCRWDVTSDVEVS